ncbi:MAG: phosphate acyltransferase PlsX [Cellvibrionaceae bacterium]|nr:phosphate acyltransferase PlsX [Cellvibrionaceae bacterium]
MSEPIHLAIDAMGGDLGPRPVVSASISLLAAHPTLKLTLVGDKCQLGSLIENSSSANSERLLCRHANDVVTMADLPGHALRHKRQSSMWQCLELVANDEADGCVSGGNTGALMALSRRLVGTIGDIKRPAICKLVPTAGGKSLLLDLGANLNCSPLQLCQFAVMGAALAKVHGCQQPKVALLNVGAETSKGVADIKVTADLLRGSNDFTFAGFIEGHNLYSGDVDVVVCDGFVGNVALKVSEGVADFIFSDLKRRFASGFISRLLFLIAAPVLRAWAERFNPAHYNGAAFLGLKKTVVKSHGGADHLGIQKAILTAIEHVEAHIPHRIALRLAGRSP